MAIKAIKDKQTKAQIISDIAEETELTRAQVRDVMQVLANQAKRHLVKRGSGEFTVPELGVKLRRKEQPARKARQGVNPFTGEPMTIKAKPKSMTVRATVLKGLKADIQ